MVVKKAKFIFDKSVAFASLNYNRINLQNSIYQINYIKLNCRENPVETNELLFSNGSIEGFNVLIENADLKQALINAIN